MSCIYALKRITEVHLELCEWLTCWNVSEEMTQSIYLNEFYPLPKVYVCNDAFRQFLDFFFSEITFKTNVIDSEENQTLY